MRISVSMSVQCLKLIKETLKSILADNASKKVTAFNNAASRAEVIKDKIDSWLNLTSSFEGDTIMINGDIQSEVKLFSATSFTSETTNPQDLIDDNKFYPRVVIATSSCVGDRLDSSSVCSVIRIGFPTSVLYITQEIGRRGRTCNGDGTNPTCDLFCFSPCKISYALMKNDVILFKMNFITILQE